MHVIMGVVNKLPIKLKRAWVEYAVQIEQQTGERAKFLDLSKFVTEKVELLILFLVEKRFKLITNLAAKARMFLQRQKM